MTNIDYKAEVKAIYKDASMRWNRSNDTFVIWITTHPFFIAVGKEVDEAWQSAYENLKKEGRIL